MTSRLVVGAGNVTRGDDGAGPEAARRLSSLVPPGVEVREHPGEGTGLLDLLRGREAAWVVDAVVSGAPPGTVHRIDAAEGPLPASLTTASSHSFGVAEGIEMLRALGELPGRLVVYGIEARAFDVGTPLTPEVDRAVGEVVARILAELEDAEPPAATSPSDSRAR